MKLRLLAIVIVGVAVLAAPAYSGGGHGLTACNGSDQTTCLAGPTASSGVYFLVSGKSTGGRSYVAVEVSCLSGTTEVYATRIFVSLDANATGKSQTIYPPVSSCTAYLEAPQAIDRFRVLDTITFVVT